MPNTYRKKWKIVRETMFQILLRTNSDKIGNERSENICIVNRIEWNIGYPIHGFISIFSEFKLEHRRISSVTSGGNQFPSTSICSTTSSLTSSFTAERYPCYGKIQQTSEYSLTFDDHSLNLEHQSLLFE